MNTLFSFFFFTKGPLGLNEKKEGQNEYVRLGANKYKGRQPIRTAAQSQGLQGTTYDTTF